MIILQEQMPDDVQDTPLDPIVLQPQSRNILMLLHCEFIHTLCPLGSV